MTNSYEIFDALLKEKSISAYQVSKDTGISTVTLTHWKQGRSTPKADKIQKIADYLGVSSEFLMGITQIKEDVMAILDENEKACYGNLTEQEKTLVRMFRDTTEEGRFEMIAAIMNIKKEKEKNHSGTDTSSVG